MHIAERRKREPLMYWLISHLFDDQAESAPPPIRNSTLVFLLILVGAGALLFGLSRGWIFRTV